MEDNLDLFSKLAAPFAPHEVKMRVQQGRSMRYVTARTVMNRLDNVLGPANWWDEYIPQGQAIVCRLTIRLPDGTTLTKCDAGGFAGMTSEEDNEKSGYSDAFKRAAVKFGVSRYLYGDGVPDWCQDLIPPLEPDGPPPAPEPAPRRERRPGPPPEPAQDRAILRPKTGRQMFAWIKDVQTAAGIKNNEVFTRIIGEAKLELGLPNRMIEWSPAEVDKVYPKAVQIARHAGASEAMTPLP